MINIHASCVEYQGKGILILGAPGFGKSDLCLKMILNHGATLVSDDRVDLQKKEDEVFAAAPENISGLLEARGVGILRLPCLKKIKIFAVVQIIPEEEKLERLPQNEVYELMSVSLPLLKIKKFDPSGIEKIIAFVRYPKIQ